MQPDMSWWRAASLVGIVVWSLAGFVLSLGSALTLVWAWSSFVTNPLWSQVLTWTVVLAPVIGVILTVGLGKTLRKHSLTAITTALVIQLIALFTPMLVT
ncbi:hypothetical protein [Brevundimonas sp. FT23028]|uniref:hypothetical protein n=1 Tax=Brevundimonas sp. FT23028 TaxID=3393748 RepID=UPI003B5890D8